MRICRFAKGERYDAPTAYAMEVEGRWVEIQNPFLQGEFKESGTAVDEKEMRLLVPCEPQKIVCVGVNYQEHAAEMAHDLPVQPLLFLKPSSALVGTGDYIAYPRQSQQVEHEVELGVVVGKRAKNVAVDEAMDYVFGYTVINDITARDLQKRDGQWTRAKGFDTFCPVGPWIETELDWKEANLSCKINGNIRQQGSTQDLIFGVPELVSFISKVMTLMPGDLIATGTPSGVSPMYKGDTVEAEVEGIGVLCNRIL